VADHAMTRSQTFPAFLSTDRFDRLERPAGILRTADNPLSFEILDSTFNALPQNTDHLIYLPV